MLKTNFSKYKKKEDFLKDFPIEGGRLDLLFESINDKDLKHILNLIGEEQSLRALYLAHNNLTTIPENGFSSLSNLRVLCLYSNTLTTIPENAFNGLSNLEKLYLTENKLTTISKNAFNGLSNLKELYLRGNKLTPLPESLQSILPNCRIFIDTDVEWVDDNEMPVITNRMLLTHCTEKRKILMREHLNFNAIKKIYKKTIEIMKNNLI